jgi:hypothetical protein
MSSVEDKRKQRLQFLHELYRMTDANENAIVDMRQVGAPYGFHEDNVAKITQYLVGEGLVKFQALGGLIGITHRGIAEVEEALTHKNEPTQHFPPASNVNIINVHTMTNSQVQQGSEGAIQVVNREKVDDIMKIIRPLRDSLDGLNLPEEQRSELESEIQTLEAQASSPKPKYRTIRSTLESISKLLQGAAGAASLLNQISILIASLGYSESNR